MSQQADFAADLEASPVELDGDAILTQVLPELRGDANKHARPSDVRLLLRTANLDGRIFQFPNHGHPDNELSSVAFDGENAIVIMPSGATPRAQLFSARQILSRLEASGLDRVTPEFMASEIVKAGALARKFTAQAYGPAPFAAQAARFVDVAIPAADGRGEIIRPDITEHYAQGMRAPTQEEALMVVYGGKPANLFIKGGEVAATYLSTLENALPANLKGQATAVEQLDGLGHLAKGIVLAVDAATGRTKPMRLETAAGIFNLSALSIIVVNEDGVVTGQYKNLLAHPKPNI